MADLFLEEVVAKNRQLFDGLDEVVENLLVAVDNVLHLLWPGHLTCITATITTIIIITIIIVIIIVSTGCLPCPAKLTILKAVYYLDGGYDGL